MLDSQTKQPSTEASTSPGASMQAQTQKSSGVPARLIGRHFLGKKESDADCKICSQHKRKKVVEPTEQIKKQKMEEKALREMDNSNGIHFQNDMKEDEHSELKDSEKRKSCTQYYCKTCPGQPNLCPVPCFEVYHTRLIYKTFS